MGEEIRSTEFSKSDFVSFESAVRAETALLHEWWHDGVLSDEGFSWGFELEAWILDHNFFPNPINAALLSRIDVFISKGMKRLMSRIAM